MLRAHIDVGVTSVTKYFANLVALEDKIMAMGNRIIPPHGGYKELKSYQKTIMISLATECFCRRFFDKWDRTVGQMVQAARSGKQNIVEASMASGTSKEMEIKLTNVAKASLEELLEDYIDYLRCRSLNQWDKYSAEAQFVRILASSKDASYESFREFAETRSGEVVANIVICLIHQASYLLRRQLEYLEQDFLKNGGLRERMSNARRRSRNSQNESPVGNPDPP